MTLLDFLILLVVAAVCGAIAEAIVGLSVGGCFVSAVVGFIGALIGMWLARQLGLPEWLAIRIGNQTFPVIWSIIGSALLLAIISIFVRRPRRRVY